MDSSWVEWPDNAEPMVVEESEEIPQVSGRLVVWTTTHLTLS